MVLIAQLAQTGSTGGSALHLATRLWLLGNGGVLDMSGVRITLVPWGFAGIVALSLHGVSGYAGKQAWLSSGPEFNRGAAVAKITGTVAATYALIVTIAALIIDPVNLRAGGLALVLGLIMGFLASRKAVRWNVYESWPIWARAIPRAISAGVLVAILGGVIVMVSGLVVHRTQIIAMTNQLNPGWVGGIVLALIQVFFALNMVIWSVSWAFGPGFTVGDGSTVSLMGSHVGLLPAFPVTAALPSGTSSLGTLAWLLVPALAGVVTAVMVLRSRPRARFDETALVGGLSGVLSGLVVVVLAMVTRGSLGQDRLSALGPLIVPMLVIAPSVMGIAGMLTGFIAGLVRRPAETTDPRWWSRWGDDTGTQTIPAKHSPGRDTGTSAVRAEGTTVLKTGGSRGVDTDSAAVVHTGENGAARSDASTDNAPAVPAGKGADRSASAHARNNDARRSGAGVTDEGPVGKTTAEEITVDYTGQDRVLRTEDGGIPPYPPDASSLNTPDADGSGAGRKTTDAGHPRGLARVRRRMGSRSQDPRSTRSPMTGSGSTPSPKASSSSAPAPSPKAGPASAPTPSPKSSSTTSPASTTGSSTSSDAPRRSDGPQIGNDNDGGVRTADNDKVRTPETPAARTSDHPGVPTPVPAHAATDETVGMRGVSSDEVTEPAPPPAPRRVARGVDEQLPLDYHADER